MSELSPMDESLRQYQAEIARAAAERAVVDAAKNIGQDILDVAANVCTDRGEDEEAQLFAALRAALSALAALETPNAPKEPHDAV